MARCTDQMRDRLKSSETYLYEGHQLIVLPYFLYEVDVYRIWENGFALVKTRRFKSNKFLKIKNYIETKYYEGHKLERSIELIGAPMSFIKENRLPVYRQKAKKNATSKKK